MLFSFHSFLFGPVSLYCFSPEINNWRTTKRTAKLKDSMALICFEAPIFRYELCCVKNETMRAETGGFFCLKSNDWSVYARNQRKKTKMESNPIRKINTNSTWRTIEKSRPNCFAWIKFKHRSCNIFCDDFFLQLKWFFPPISLKKVVFYCESQECCENIVKNCVQFLKTNRSLKVQ